MAKPGRKRRINAERYPNGDIKPTVEVSPTTIKRLMMAAAARMADPEWATVVGRYFLTGQISSEQYQAAKKLGALSESYDRMMQGPKPPAQVAAERIVSAQVDPFSEAGEAEVERHKAVADSLDKVRAIFGDRGVFEEARRLCHGVGELPESYERFLMIRTALGSLAVYWKIDARK